MGFFGAAILAGCGSGCGLESSVRGSRRSEFVGERTVGGADGKAMPRHEPTVVARSRAVESRKREIELLGWSASRCDGRHDGGDPKVV